MPMGRQGGGNYYEDNRINAGEENTDINGRGSFAFPTMDSPYPFDNPNSNTNKNVRPLPPQHGNHDNYYPSRPYPAQQKQEYQQFQHQQQQQQQQYPFNSNLNSNLPNVPGYDNYRKTTYQQNYPNYAQNHGNYLNNNQRPNYYRPQYSQPLPPSRPQTVPNKPNRPTPIYFGGGYGSYGGPNQSSNSQYAGQFSNFLGPLSNLLGGGGGTPSYQSTLSNLLGGGGGGGTPSYQSSSPSTNAILQGLEKISRNDDLECVPKVLCQMVGNPQRRAQLPSYITSPALQA